MFTQVAELFHDLDAGMLPVSVLFPYLPIPQHRRRDRWVPLERYRIQELHCNWSRVGMWRDAMVPHVEMTQRDSTQSLVCGPSFPGVLPSGSASILGARKWAAGRAREELARIFSQVIRARRASGACEDDILQCFIDSRYDKARPAPPCGSLWLALPEWVRA